MKDLLIGGTRFLTTDELADSLLEYSGLLNLYNSVDLVRFPAIVGGTSSHSAIALGAGSALVVVDAPDVIPVRIAGAGEAAADIRRRSARYRDGPEESPPHPEQ
ncbi:hypothetical protein GCM10009775_23490 [Microbacterium aoyamense]|uniref:Uncharacterized protein n=1 Tax=Microbacterium aoyamense TaxID=344166 RepID=A0ABP5B4L6_9MICO|nr:hypothetical protein [Microbacterium aoyamense]